MAKQRLLLKHLYIIPVKAEMAEEFLMTEDPISNIQSVN